MATDRFDRLFDEQLKRTLDKIDQIMEGINRYRQYLVAQQVQIDRIKQHIGLEV